MIKTQGRVVLSQGQGQVYLVSISPKGMEGQNENKK